MTSDFSEVFVGTYNGPDQSGKFAGNGIFHVRLDHDSGAIGAPRGVAQCSNPSYLAWGADRQHLYAVKEVVDKHQPELLSFRVEGKNTLHPLNETALVGELPCHLAINGSGDLLACAQYLTGNVLLYALNPDGRIGSLVKNIQHFGSGPDASRQEGPHAHFVGFLPGAVHLAPERLVIADLGLDRVFSYPLSVEGSIDVAVENKALTFGAKLPGGVGPRHLAAFKGSDFVYVFCEMQAKIFIFDHRRPVWKLVQSQEVLEVNVAGKDSGAAIKISPDGRFLYVSERSRSKIAVFSIDQKSGRIFPLQSIASGGEGPRDIAISRDGKFLLAANQQSNNLVSFNRDPGSGRLGFSGYEVEIDQPACILF